MERTDGKSSSRSILSIPVVVVLAVVVVVLFGVVGVVVWRKRELVKHRKDKNSKDAKAKHGREMIRNSTRNGGSGRKNTSKPHGKDQTQTTVYGEGSQRQHVGTSRGRGKVESNQVWKDKSEADLGDVGEWPQGNFKQQSLGHQYMEGHRGTEDVQNISKQSKLKTYH